jgi:hypothetical protein
MTKQNKKLLQVLNKIKRMTAPEDDDIGYANSDLLEIVMAVQNMAQKVTGELKS